MASYTSSLEALWECCNERKVLRAKQPLKDLALHRLGPEATLPLLQLLSQLVGLEKFGKDERKLVRLANFHLSRAFEVEQDAGVAARTFQVLEKGADRSRDVALRISSLRTLACVSSLSESSLLTRQRAVGVLVKQLRELLGRASKEALSEPGVEDKPRKSRRSAVFNFGEDHCKELIPKVSLLQVSFAGFGAYARPA
jgi:hypothetical protein